MKGRKEKKKNRMHNACPHHGQSGIKEARGLPGCLLEGLVVQISAGAGRNKTKKKKMMMMMMMMMMMRGRGKKEKERA